MVRNLSYLAAAFLLFSATAGCGPPREGKEWLNPIPGGWTATRGRWSDVEAGEVEKPIGEEHVFEVVFSKEPVTRALLEKPFLLVEDRHARSYTGPYFECSSGRRPYLVRAVYGQVGDFSVSRLADALIVTHSSVMDRPTFHKSALVVCLDFEPIEVFHQVQWDQ